MNIKNKGAEASGASVGSNVRGRIGRSKGDVSDVRGVDNTAGDDVRRLQLSGMQSRDSEGGTGRLSEESEGMGEDPGVLTEYDFEIELVNAFRELSKKKIPLKKAHPKVVAHIEREFISWIENRILELMGRKSPVQEFSEEEVLVLKAMAARVMTKAVAPQNSAEKPQQTQKPKSSLSPLKDSIDMKAYNEQQMKILSEVAKLEKMHNSGPEY